MKDVACGSANFDPIQPIYQEYLNSFDQRQQYNMTNLGTEELLWNQISLHSDKISRINQASPTTNSTLPYSSLRFANYVQMASTQGFTDRSNTQIPYKPHINNHSPSPS